MQLWSQREERGGGGAGKFAVSRLVPGGWWALGGGGLVVGVLGRSVPECLGAEEGDVKAGLYLPPSLRTRSLTFLAGSWGGGGWLASSPE